MKKNTTPYIRQLIEHMERSTSKIPNGFLTFATSMAAKLDEIEGKAEAAQQSKLTPAVERVLTAAEIIASNQNMKYVGTDHVLLAIIQQPDGPAKCVLKRSGVEKLIVSELKSANKILKKS